MQKRTVVIEDVVKKYENPIGELVQVACQFKSDISLLSGTRKINAKSIMGIMAISPYKGMELDVETNGNDEEAALDAMTHFLQCI